MVSATALMDRAASPSACCPSVTCSRLASAERVTLLAASAIPATWARIPAESSRARVASVALVVELLTRPSRPVREAVDLFGRRLRKVVQRDHGPGHVGHGGGDSPGGARHLARGDAQPVGRDEYAVGVTLHRRDQVGHRRTRLVVPGDGAGEMRSMISFTVRARWPSSSFEGSGMCVVTDCTVRVRSPAAKALMPSASPATQFCSRLSSRSPISLTGRRMERTDQTRATAALAPPKKVAVPRSRRVLSSAALLRQRNRRP